MAINYVKNGVHRYSVSIKKPEKVSQNTFFVPI